MGLVITYLKAGCWDAMSRAPLGEVRSTRDIGMVSRSLDAGGFKCLRAYCLRHNIVESDFF